MLVKSPPLLSPVLYWSPLDTAAGRSVVIGDVSRDSQVMTEKGKITCLFYIILEIVVFL